MQVSRFYSTSTSQHPVCPVKLSYAVTLPLLLKDICPPNDAGGKPLGETVVEGASQIPGKFYQGAYALTMTNALCCDGSCARGVLDENATEQDTVQLQRFMARLMNGDLVSVMQILSAL